MLGRGKAAEHLPAPLIGAEIHDAGRCRGRNARDIKLPGEVPPGRRAVRQHPGGPFPVAGRERFLVLHQMAEAVADRPGSADVFFDRLGSAQAFHAPGVKPGESLVVPTDHATHLVAERVHAPGSVVRGGDAAGHPVLQAAEFA